MRKIVFILAVVMSSFIIASCSDDDNDNSKAIEFSEMPADSQDFIKKHFGNEGAFDESEIRRVEVESNGEYEVLFVNGIEVDFYANGVWKEIDLNGKQLPNSIAMLLPSNALNYISSKYPNSQIEEIEKQGVYSETQGFKIELRGDRDIYFDYLGNVLKDKGETSQGENNVAKEDLPESIQLFLSTYFADQQPSKIKLEWDKYEIVYNEDKADEIEVEFFKDGSFKSVDLESENAVVKDIIKGVTKSNLILEYLDANHAGLRIEEFSMAPAILGAKYKDGYIVELDGGKTDYKVYFNASSAHITTIID
ncbi:PepSY-like domain-containing protein [Dysgonomonas massiliensis]|uniref:PepSY-like domain-containing protein n=1 Tax=Dysgonomonas massiliensis TaxID=2040292 RepID=UPI000C76ED29|nr:PepSY-like domain-containing protein [Dysgonomonas massiliensis]